jgi:hypothetical protein
MDLGLALMPGLNLDANRELFLSVDPTLEWGVIDYDETVTLPTD